MSRTVITVKTNASRDSVLQYLSVELPRLGYTDRSTPTERIWGKNDGVMVKGQRISVNFQPGEVYLSAWLHDALLGGIRSAGDRGQAHEEPSEAGTRPDSRRHRGPPRSPLCHPSERDLLQCLRKCLQTRQFLLHPLRQPPVKNFRATQILKSMLYSKFVKSFVELCVF